MIESRRARRLSIIERPSVLRRDAIDDVLADLFQRFDASADGGRCLLGDFLRHPRDTLDRCLRGAGHPFHA